MANTIISWRDHKKTSQPVNFEKLVDTELHKPAQYIGGELGVSTKPWESANVRWILSYPELYEVGASNLGHIILYSIINNLPGQLCDRTYLPEEDFKQRLRETSNRLFGVETRRELTSFDLVGFSLSYELGATNILEMLSLAGIKFYSKERNNLSINNPNSAPLIFAGGPTATSNPEPYANFFDFFALGDGEELLPEIGLVISESKKANHLRSEVLLSLAEIPGIYVPSLYKQSKDFRSIEPIHQIAPKKIIRRVATPMPHYSMGLVPNVETVHDRLTIEIRRGCTRGCRFCQPGMLTRPARDVAPQDVISAVEQGMKKTGYSDFSLLSLSCSDYLSLPQVGVALKNKLGDRNITLQLPSQRVDRFDSNIAHILGGSRQAGLTFAPEAGSQRLRDIINKGLTNDDLLHGIRTAMENKYRKVKLYFMIGLPGEEDEDVKDIARTCRWLQKECKSIGNLKLNITISNFTPKPHTPFQWHSVSTNELIRRQECLKNEFKILQVKNIKVNFTDVRISAIENFLGRGDRRLSTVIESAWESGAGMDAWYESQDRAYNAWTSAISKAGLENQLRKLEMGNWQSAQSFQETTFSDFCAQPLPWDHIDTGIDKKWLAEDLQKALQATTVDDCSFHGCSNCGVCGPELGHNQIIKPTSSPSKAEINTPKTVKACRIRVTFAKTKPMHFISHLDLLRLLERALRRSELPISFTGGFHPLPRLQIALALPLGVEGLGELMDIDFFQEVDPARVKKELQVQLPLGIQILETKVIQIKKNSLAKELQEAKWSFCLESIEKSEFDLPKVKEELKKIMTSKTLIWKDIDKKGRQRERDLRPELREVRLINKETHNQLLEKVNKLSIELKTFISPIGQSVKPIHIQFWLSKALEDNLKLQEIQRNELILKKC